MNERTGPVLLEILGEREAQDDKWGEQNHPGSMWLAILTEEVGEAAKALLENFNSPPLPSKYGDEARDPAGLRSELIQVAAVATAWVEAIDRAYDNDPGYVPGKEADEG